jgi:trk system potassium uptake protein
MTVIVIGCGRVGAELAYRLYLKGHQVTVVDLEPDSFSEIHGGFRGRTVVGDCLSREVLERAGIESCDAVAVVSNSDSVNAVAAHVAHTVFGVPIVVARNYDPSRRRIFDDFGIHVVSTANWVADQVEELLAGKGLRSVLSAGGGEACVYEFTVSTQVAGRRLLELVADDVRPVALTRGGRGVLADPAVVLEAGDVLLLAATGDGAARLQGLLTEGLEG